MIDYLLKHFWWLLLALYLKVPKPRAPTRWKEITPRKPLRVQPKTDPKRVPRNRLDERKQRDPDLAHWRKMNPIGFAALELLPEPLRYQSKRLLLALMLGEFRPLVARYDIFGQVVLEIVVELGQILEAHDVMAGDDAARKTRFDGVEELGYRQITQLMKWIEDEEFAMPQWQPRKNEELPLTVMRHRQIPPKKYLTLRGQRL